MSIVTLDGELDFEPFEKTTSTVHLQHKTTKATVTFSPHTFHEKWKVPSNGFYTPTDVRIVITPHISEKAGVMATIKLVDASDMSPSRVLYQSQEFNLGHGLTLEGSQLPFCLPVGEYPIQFEVTVLRSPFRETRTTYSTSLSWRMMWSPTPLSRVKSVFATATEPVKEAITNFKIKPKAQSSRLTAPKHKQRKQLVRDDADDGGTDTGLVTSGSVGSSAESSNVRPMLTLG